MESVSRKGERRRNYAGPIRNDGRLDGFWRGRTRAIQRIDAVALMLYQDISLNNIE